MLRFPASDRASTSLERFVSGFFRGYRMSIAIVTGSGGLIGAETVKLFAERGLDIVGIDNDMRSQFFGAEASTRWQSSVLQNSVRGFAHYDVDIRDETAIGQVFERYG